MNARLPKYPKHGAGIGLHRVQALCERLGLDLTRLRRRSCNVAGSSGKGSTATSLAALLGGAGLRVGCFTSPHLLRIHERLQIDGRPIDEAALDHHWQQVEAACDAYLAEHPGDQLGGFEFLYLLALRWFAAEGVDFAVFECGIGGRYDPTRLGRPAWATVVSVDLEHTALLGRTLAEIACDKSDTAPPGAELVLGDSLLPLQGLLRTYAGLRDVRPQFVQPGADWEALAQGLDGSRLRVRLHGERWLALEVPLAGRFQGNNVAIAARLASMILRDEFALADEAVDRALAAGAQRIRWPGRLQAVSREPLVVIDVGHTPRAVRQALVSLRELVGARELVLVCGVSADKNAAEIVDVLAPSFRRIVCVQAAHKGTPAAEIAALVRRAQPDAECAVAASMAEACAVARALAAAVPGGGIYAAGGLFLAIEFQTVLQGGDATTLRFY